MKKFEVTVHKVEVYRLEIWAEHEGDVRDHATLCELQYDVLPLRTCDRDEIEIDYCRFVEEGTPEFGDLCVDEDNRIYEWDEDCEEESDGEGEEDGPIPCAPGQKALPL